MQISSSNQEFGLAPIKKAASEGFVILGRGMLRFE